MCSRKIPQGVFLRFIFAIGRVVIDWHEQQNERKNDNCFSFKDCFFAKPNGNYFAIQGGKGHHIWFKGDMKNTCFFLHRIQQLLLRVVKKLINLRGDKLKTS